MNRAPVRKPRSAQVCEPSSRPGVWSGGPGAPPAGGDETGGPAPQPPPGPALAAIPARAWAPTGPARPDWSIGPKRLGGGGPSRSAAFPRRCRRPTAGGRRRAPGRCTQPRKRIRPPRGPARAPGGQGGSTLGGVHARWRDASHPGAAVLSPLPSPPPQNTDAAAGTAFAGTAGRPPSGGPSCRCRACRCRGAWA